MLSIDVQLNSVRSGVPRTQLKTWYIEEIRGVGVGRTFNNMGTSQGNPLISVLHMRNPRAAS